MSSFDRLLNKLLSLYCWLRRQNLLILAGFGAAAFLLLVFIAIADAVSDGDTHAIDKAILLVLRTPGDAADPLGGRRFERIMTELTTFGDTTVLTVIVIAVGLYLLLAGRGRLAALAVGAALGGTILSNGLKALFDRPRPDFVAHIVDVSNPSFPSGHAMMSAVVYLTLGGMLAAAHARKRLKAFCIGLALTLTLMVGFTRVYLGVHYPTDVLAGWALGAAWALACMLLGYGISGKKSAGAQE